MEPLMEPTLKRSRSKKKSSRKTKSRKTTNPDQKFTSSVVDVYNCSSSDIIDEDALLSSLCSPVSKMDFFANYFRQKALVTHSSMTRFSTWIERGLCDLNVLRLMQSSPSDPIQGWIRQPSNGKIESIAAINPRAGEILYNAGHSLYFRAPLELSEVVIPALSQDLGLGFTSTVAGSHDLNGEIEIFCARAGHTTDWHFDFMENFTIQLSGSKVWKLQKGNIRHVVRSCTPHYQTQDVVEQQMKLHLQARADFQYHPPSEEDYETVTLEPGSILYFPAGMWHRVESRDDSLSMNLSLFLTSKADVVLDALRQVLYGQEHWREGCAASHTVEDIRSSIQSLLADLPNQVAKLSAADIIPEKLWQEGRTSAALDSEEEEEQEQDEATGLTLADFPRSSWLPSLELRKNPLAQLLRQTDIPAVHSRRHSRQIDEIERDNTYIVHVGFGQSNFESTLREEFTCTSFQSQVIDWLVEHLKNDECHIYVRDLPFRGDRSLEQVDSICQYLEYIGYLTILHAL